MGNTRKRVAGREELRLWLRMLSCTNLIESRIRGRLRDGFSTTLPRFDVLAQLDAASKDAPEGLTLGELSRRLMVTNGNLTGLTERLVKEGMISRAPSPRDRRIILVRLTNSGKRALDAMASGHRQWIEFMFSGLSHNEVAQLFELMAKLRDSVHNAPLEGLQK